MTDKHGRHDASSSRALIREAKSGWGRDLARLLDDAKNLRDPYFTSLTLFELSADPRLKLKRAVSIAEEALETAGRVERLWRRAELLAVIANKVNSWRDKAAVQSRERLLDDILEAIEAMHQGQGLSDAIQGCASSIYCDRLVKLLTIAVSNKGFEAADAKAVIRQWAKHCKEKEPTMDEILDILVEVDNGEVRSRLMGYMHLQCKESGMSLGSQVPLKSALEAAITLKKEERLEVLRYLAGLSSTKEELEIVSGALESLEDQADRARFFATLGGCADKVKQKEMALDWFRQGLEESSQLVDSHQRINIRLNLAQGLARCGEVELSLKTYKKALDDCGDNKKLMSRICKSMDDQGFELPEICKAKDLYLRKSSKGPGAEQVEHTHNILALYDTYEGGLKSVHLRAVARAAPLCFAFGLDLALMGFPTDDLEELVNLVITDTNVGKGGRYLRELIEKGRIVLVQCTQHKPPKDWSELGLPVATTSHPKEDKKVGMAEAIKLARSKHPLGRVCLLMGLGKRGLSPSLLDAVSYHLELTGSNVPLETCTAMGVIAQLMRSVEK